LYTRNSSFFGTFGDRIKELKLLATWDRKKAVVVLPDSFRGMRSWRNSTETQQSGHTPRSGPEVKNGSNGSPSHCGGAVPAPLTSSEPKWRVNFPKGSGLSVASNRLEKDRSTYIMSKSLLIFLPDLKFAKITTLFRLLIFYQI